MRILRHLGGHHSGRPFRKLLANTSITRTATTRGATGISTNVLSAYAVYELPIGRGTTGWNKIFPRGCRMHLAVDTIRLFPGTRIPAFTLWRVIREREPENRPDCLGSGLLPKTVNRPGNQWFSPLPFAPPLRAHWKLSGPGSGHWARLLLTLISACKRIFRSQKE